MYRWLVLSLVAFILAHWGYLSLNITALPNWAHAARVVFEAALPQVAIAQDSVIQNHAMAAPSQANSGTDGRNDGAAFVRRALCSLDRRTA
jgi:hypothetical protein